MEKRCFECGNKFVDGNKVTKGNLDYHSECWEEFCNQQIKERELEIKSEKKQEKLLTRLKRNLKPKIFQAIEWEKESHKCSDFCLVDKSKVEGEKLSGTEYFGESSAIRHVYSSVESCSYSGCYGGFVFIRLAKNRYLKVHVSG